MSKTRVVNRNQELYDVFIGRPSKWGNPFFLGGDNMKRRLESIEKYREWIKAQPKLIAEAKNELKGKILGCYCKPKPCHGDVLVEIVDEA